jgi:CO/xanthine dehydrogenase Mo-binding subunit
MVVGKLIEDACLTLRQRLAKHGTWTPGDVTGFAAACQALAASQSSELRADATYTAPPDIYWDDQTYQGDAYATYAWAVYVADVAVDTDTYEIRVEDFVAVQDVGRVVHPLLAAGQIEGGVAQAIGYALSEKVVWAEGAMKNNSMTNYIMPTSADLPPIRVFFVPWKTAHGPGGGAKGLGELPLDGGAPAILNAISQAMGVRAAEIPYLPENLLEDLPR